jgi:hypothetical protein
MNATEFFFTYLILIITGTFFVSGFYIITRPDKIFSFWSKFWEKIIDIERSYYAGEELLNKFYYLKRDCHQVGVKIEAGVTAEDRVALRVVDGMSITGDDKMTIREFLYCETEVISSSLFFYSNVNIYRFPEIVRYPLSACPPCMASVFGSLYWWCFVLLQQDAFVWSYNERTAYFLYWIFFCISLSFLNKFIDKKVNY